MRSINRNRLTIGLLAGWQTYPGTIHSFLDTVYRGAAAAAQDFDCNLLIGCGVGMPFLTQSGPALPLRVPWADFIPVGPWNTDGLVALGPFTADTANTYFQGLIDAGFPVVYGGDRETGPSVMVDNEGGIIDAVTHLAGHGRRRIAFLAGYDMTHGDSAGRMRGFRAGLEQNGLRFDPDLVVHGYHEYNSSAAALRELLQQGARFDALIGSNDEAAVAAMDVMASYGLSVPEDVAVIGFDDRLEARAQIPLLTSIHHPMFEMGYSSVELLIQIIQGTAAPNTLLRIPTRLVVRESCGCLLAEKGPQPARRGKEPAYEMAVSSGDALDSAVVQDMSAGVFIEMHRLGKREVDYLCRRLFNAFRASLEHEDPRDFRLATQMVLEYALALDEDIHPWQNAVTALDEWLPHLQSALRGCSTMNASPLLHQARIAISEMQRGRAARQAVRSSVGIAQISAMTAQFFTADSDEQIFSVLCDRLPSIGVRSACLAYYQPEGDDPYARSVLQFHTGDGGEMITPPSQESANLLHFATRSFPPPGMFNEESAFQLAVLPLTGNQGVLGFAAFQTNDMALLGFLVRQLNGALRGARLYQEAIKARHAAEEANRLKSRFLSIVSHELRTPLNLIFGLSNMLLTESQPINQEEILVTKKDLERIFLGAQHLESLIRDVLDLASSDVGRLQLVSEPLDLLPVLHGTAGIGEKLANDKDLTWETSLPTTLPVVLGDRTRLRQVILNLVYNAVKFTVKGGIKLSASAGPAGVTVAVSDTGLGIPLCEQEAIFDEFRRSNRTTARGFGGLGLGLSICKRLVEMHGGSIGVYSSGEEGAGSTFYFSLPTVSSHTGPVRPNSAEDDDQQRVLLLVKNIDHGLPLQAALASRGFAVTLAAVDSGEDWLAATVLPLLPDQVILDMELTAERGWEILKTLKEHPDTHMLPVLFHTLTGENSSGSLLDLNFLSKPLNATALAETLLLGLESQKESSPPRPILVVDDDPEILSFHTRLIESMACDHAVLQAHNGREALEAIQRERPALVLLDLMMPEIDGFTLLEKMQASETARGVPVIVLTSQTLTEDDMQRLNGCVAGVLAKGMFSAEETIERISSALVRKRRPNADTQRIVHKAMAFIHRRYTDPITRSDVATAAGLSERHLTRCFHLETGLTPMAYLNRYRVRQACLLLETTNRSITEIALDVGFSNSGYFTRVFKEETGLTPREYSGQRNA